MTIETAIAFATFLLENDYVLTLNEGINHLANNLSTLYGGGTYGYVTIGVNQQNLVELYCVAFVHIGDVMNIQLLASLGAELLSLDFYNCVHLIIVLKVGPCGGSDPAVCALICAYRDKLRVQRYYFFSNPRNFPSFFLKI